MKRITSRSAGAGRIFVAVSSQTERLNTALADRYELVVVEYVFDELRAKVPIKK